MASRSYKAMSHVQSLKECPALHLYLGNLVRDLRMAILRHTDMNRKVSLLTSVANVVQNNKAVLTDTFHVILLQNCLVMCDTKKATTERNIQRSTGEDSYVISSRF